MKTKKILFAIPRVKSMYGDSQSRPLYPHVGIAYLTAVLKKAGYQVAIFDQGIESETQKLYQLIDQFQPDIIGTTGYSYASTFLKNLIIDIKSHSPIPVIVGGPHVSAVTKNILIETKADFAMISESEASFPLFLHQFFQKKPNYSQVPGLIWKKHQAIAQNPQANFIIDLDKVPFPDYDAFRFDQYTCYQEKKIPLTTSRGCPYGCNYCSVKLSMGQCFRPRSAQNVFAEIKYWYSRGFNKIDINDDCFTLDINRAEKICDLIIKNKFKLQIQLYNGIRVDRVTPKLLKKLKRAGCIFIAYGCESGSQKIINQMGKKIKLNQVKQAVLWTNQAGIKNAVNFIIGHPNETYQNALESLRFANSLPTNFVNFYNLVPYPGTDAYNWVVKNGRFLLPPKKFLESSSYRDNNPIFDTPEFTEKQRHQVMATGFNLYEKKLLRFRLGKNFGYFVYLITRIKPISQLAHWLLTNSKLISTLTVRLISKSKK